MGPDVDVGAVLIEGGEPGVRTEKENGGVLIAVGPGIENVVPLWGCVILNGSAADSGNGSGSDGVADLESVRCGVTNFDSGAVLGHEIVPGSWESSCAAYEDCEIENARAATWQRLDYEIECGVCQRQ